MDLTLFYWPDTHNTRLAVRISASEITDDSGCVLETKMAGVATRVWPEHKGGWMWWEPTTEAA